MSKFSYTLISICLLSYLTSCFPAHMISEKASVTQVNQSKFAIAKTVGMKKDDVIKQFGEPFTTSFERKENVLNEGLYYLESLGDIHLVTILTITNGMVTAQKVEQITANYDSRFKQIERDIKILQTPRLYN